LKYVFYFKIVLDVYLQNSCVILEDTKSKSAMISFEFTLEAETDLNREKKVINDACLPP